MSRGFPVAPCAPCGGERLVFADPERDGLFCMGCGGPVAPDAVRRAPRGFVEAEMDYAFADVTDGPAEAEAACGGCCGPDAPCHAGHDEAPE